MRFLLAGTLALLAATSTPAWGQGPRLGGVSLERFYVEGERFTTINYRHTHLRDSVGKAGLDLAVGLVPRGLAEDAAIIQLEAGLARTLSVGPLKVLLRGGASSFTAITAHGAGIFPGVHGGLAAILPLEKQARARIDVTRHVYFGLGGGHLAAWSVGVGFAVLSPP